MPGLKHHILGLCGYAGAGKDTVADLLVTHAGFRKIAFADALRAELVEAFHVESPVFTRREHKHLPLQELALSRCTDKGYLGAALTHLAEIEPDVPVNLQLVKPRTPRETMQLWGTQYRRAQDADYWTKQVRGTINYFMHECHERNFVITDVRFTNEAETLRNLGGWIWQVNRVGITAATTPEGQHASVTDGTEFAPEAVIGNYYDMKHLQQAVLGEFWALDAGLIKVSVEIAA